MKTLTPEQIALIKQPLPAEAITQHPTKTYLSSIKAIYVTERLNDVFGIGAWRIKTDEISINDKGMAVVKVTFEIPDYGIYYESFGGNDNGGSNNKNFDLGDAYKGATTDAITKIASFLGIGIDVFKGKQKGGNTPKTNTTENTDNLHWIAQENIDKLTDLIADGKHFTLADIRKKYKVSKVNAEKLKAIGIN